MDPAPEPDYVDEGPIEDDYVDPFAQPPPEEEAPFDPVAEEQKLQEQLNPGVEESPFDDL